jgi:uncharacterized membrane protein SpoIIM required for sporulation
VKASLRWTLYAGTWLAVLLAMATLVSGQDWLGEPTPLLGITAGNFVAWVVAIAVPLGAWLVLPHGLLRRTATVLLVAGGLWLPVVVVLAGNPRVNFTGGWRPVAWLVYTGACLLLPVALTAGRAVARLWARLRGRRG